MTAERSRLQSAEMSVIVRRRMRRPRHALVGSALSMLLVVLAVAGVVLGAASIPHNHAAGHPGLYNQEHDLSYLATFGGAAPLPDAPSAAPLVLLVVLAATAVAGAPPVVWRRHADFRAPPVR